MQSRRHSPSKSLAAIEGRRSNASHWGFFLVLMGAVALAGWLVVTALMKVWKAI